MVCLVESTFHVQLVLFSAQSAIMVVGDDATAAAVVDCCWR